MVLIGRKAKPINLHLLEGNSNRLTKDEIEQRLKAEKQLQAKKDKVKPPTWLDSVAKKEFRRIAGELLELDVITNIDVNALATYCDAYSDYVECTKIIREEGLLVEYTNKAAETNKVPHPLLTKKKQLHEQMKTLAVEFGLTPSARAKIVIPNIKQGPKTNVEKEFDV
ncbi:MULTISPECIES: phage terminase small subunit P27 family [Bacillus cereus group]|uniref:Terminase n=1 Tax=Bacillus thuringiensis serovar mexicanensis TaxID=180868 RepID=A0A242WGB4_BACTU|nr:MULTISPECIES: phage terminase small subunit P27 family [Bacillus cereus group]EEM55724.1 Phage Terminase Small Subunit [Bacillus thuringiensis serovar monterrey BGSC 4AJ1]MEB9673420.1 phage terminase small subunit P27 family [Bacillus anthracis]OTW54262.1 terminase [Bacillus thuringiensis serovar mexicanensis]OTW96114.1 terminase [Bacillus thuringiensis serovar monterrey]